MGCLIEVNWEPRSRTCLSSPVSVGFKRSISLTQHEVQPLSLNNSHRASYPPCASLTVPLCLAPLLSSLSALILTPFGSVTLSL